MLKSVDEEIGLSDKIWSESAFSSLREQMDTDYKFWADYNYKVPQRHGKWENVSDNSPRILMNKIIGLLSASHPNLFVASVDGDKAQRTSISKAEQVVLGALAAANKALTSKPLGKTIQDSLSFFAPMRGVTIYRIWHYEKNGKMYPDYKVYDPINCTFKPYRFEYRYYEDAEYLNYQYDIKVENSSRPVLCREIWTPGEWGVLVENKYVQKVKTNLDYIPVRVSTCGSVPSVRSEKYSDTLKHACISAYFNNRDLYDHKSEMLSVLLTRGLEAGKIKIVGKYDSTFSQGEIPDELKRLGYTGNSEEQGSSGDGRNELIMLDTAKGQDFVSTVAPPPDNQLLDSFRIFNAMDVLGSVDPVAYGQLNRSGASGALAQELRNSALEFMIPFRRNIQGQLAWGAEETLRQFKNLDFSKSTFKGKYGNQRFSVDVSPEEIEEEDFECQLVIDRLRDEAQEVGLAIQKVQSGLVSKRTARVQHNIVQDPDAEAEKIDVELAEQDVVTRYDKLAAMYADLRTPDGDRRALYYQAMAQIEIDKALAQMTAPPSVPDRGMNNPGVTPQTESGRIMSDMREF